MKRNLLFNQTTAIGKRLAMVLTMLLIVGIGQAWGETYLLGWGSASGTAGAYTNFTTTSGTVNNIVSFSTAKNSGSAPAYNSNNSELRLYYASNGSGGSITLTPATGITITGFVMTTSTAPTVKYKVGSGNLTTVSKASNANTYTVSNINATSSSALTIQNANTSNTQLRIKTIQITYTKSGGNTSVSSVSLNHSTLSLEVGETSTLIATVLPNNATNKTVTWSSSNAAVATVSDGVVAAVSAGSTTITVKTEDGDKTATCNVTVTAPAGGGGSSDGECTWELVTDASDLKAGDQIVITAAEVDMALSTTQQTNNRTGTAITKTNNKLEINSFVQILILEEGSESGTFAFKDTDGTNNGYLYAASSSSNHLKTKAEKDKHGAFSIEINGKGVASIQAKASSNRNVLRYNPGNTPPLFSCYESGKMSDVSIYKKVCTAETTHYLLRK